MGQKAKYSKEVKLEIVTRYLKGESAISLTNEYGLPASIDDKVRKWAHKYEIYGDMAFDYFEKNLNFFKKTIDS